jgi:hypothetical protein
MNNPEGKYTFRQQFEMLTEIERITQKLMREWNVDISRLDDNGKDLYAAYDELDEVVMWAKNTLYQIRNTQKEENENS